LKVSWSPKGQGEHDNRSPIWCMDYSNRVLSGGSGANQGDWLPYSFFFRATQSPIKAIGYPNRFFSDGTGANQGDGYPIRFFHGGAVANKKHMQVFNDREQRKILHLGR
jgi:hypothetical protein